MALRSMGRGDVAPALFAAGRGDLAEPGLVVIVDLFGWLAAVATPFGENGCRGLLEIRPREFLAFFHGPGKFRAFDPDGL